jgi:hypothetical protein
VTSSITTGPDGRLLGSGGLVSGGLALGRTLERVTRGMAGRVTACEGRDLGQGTQQAVALSMPVPDEPAFCRDPRDLGRVFAPVGEGAFFAGTSGDAYKQQQLSV